MVILFVPPFISIHDVEVKRFWSFLYKAMYAATNSIIWQNEDNYIITHQGKLRDVLNNGKQGYKLQDEGCLLKGIFKSLTVKKPDYKTIKQLEKVGIISKYLNNAYYNKLIKYTRFCSTHNKKTDVLELVSTFHALENKQLEKVSPELVSKIEDYNIAFEALDQTVPELELKTHTDQFIYKVYMLMYAKEFESESLFRRIHDEFKAQINVDYLKKVLDKDIDYNLVFEQEVLPIEDGDYVMVDDESIQLYDNNDPHEAYMNEEEEGASASSDSLIN